MFTSQEINLSISPTLTRASSSPKAVPVMLKTISATPRPALHLKLERVLPGKGGEDFQPEMYVKPSLDLFVTPVSPFPTKRLGLSRSRTSSDIARSRTIMPSQTSQHIGSVSFELTPSISEAVRVHLLPQTRMLVPSPRSLCQGQIGENCAALPTKKHCFHNMSQRARITQSSVVGLFAGNGESM